MGVAVPCSAGPRTAACAASGATGGECDFPASPFFVMPESVVGLSGIQVQGVTTAFKATRR